MGVGDVAELRDVGRMLASLKEPEPPKGFSDAGRLFQMARALWDMKPVSVRHPVCQQTVFVGGEIDLGQLPVQTCWPGDAGPLITWGLVVTRGPQGVAVPRKRQNLGIYRQQVIGPRQTIMRWLAHRGGALDFRDFALANPGRAVSAGGGAGSRSGDDPGRRDARARYAVGVPVRRSAARHSDRAGRQRRRRRRPDAAGPSQRRTRTRRLYPDSAGRLRRPERTRRAR